MASTMATAAEGSATRCSLSAFILWAEIVQTFAEEAALKDGKLDLALVRPLLFDMTSLQYWGRGPAIAPCWNIGRRLLGKRANQP